MHKIAPKLSNSKFVEISTDEHFIIEPQYPLLKMKHATNHCYVREEVFHMLTHASLLLPQGYKLKIWDGWRPFALQQELYDIYSNDILKTFNASELPQEEQLKIISQFVSIPVKDKALSPLHTTGGAIDVTLVDENGNELNMGTDFDSFAEESATNYFELNNINREVRNNRRILYNCMIDAGFVNLPSEWWHYDFGDRHWASQTNNSIIYNGVFEELDIQLTNKK